MSSNTGTLAAIGDTLVLSGIGEMTHVHTLSGTFSSVTLVFEVSPDGTNWFATSVVRLSDGEQVETAAAISAKASYVVPANGMQSRVRVTGLSSITSLSARIDGLALPIGAILPPPRITNDGTANSAPQTSLAAATANGNGTTIDFTTSRRTFGMQVVLGGDVVPTGGTIVLQLSNDSTNWTATALATFTIGTSVNKDFVYVVDKPARYARAVLAGLTGGTNPTVTATITGVG